MKVKNIFFIARCPGSPVYEMEDGTIRIPFTDKKTGNTFHPSEAELTKGVSDVKTLKAFREPFTLARIDIDNIKIAEFKKPKLKIVGNA